MNIYSVVCVQYEKVPGRLFSDALYLSVTEFLFLSVCCELLCKRGFVFIAFV